MMGMTQMTRPLAAGDGRLKVLWLDDMIDRIAPWHAAAADYEPWFSLVYATHPSDVSDLVHESIRQGVGNSKCWPIYNAPGMPYDAYVVDFRMCDRIDEGCTLSEHIEGGLHAPSAGFLVGVLTALRWPRHPQAIIPYSGYDEEFGQIWRLMKQFCPSTISVLWDDSVTKGSRSQRELLDLIPKQCREALQLSVKKQIACMPLKERDRWENLLEAGDSEPIPADEQICLTSDYGARSYLVGALFYDHMDRQNRTVPADFVREWVSMLPVADPLEIEARKLAEFYWKLRCNEKSRDIYTIARALKDGKDIPGLPEKPPSCSWLCHWKVKGDGRETSVRMIRLALLFLMLREHECRVNRKRYQEGLSEDCRRLLGMIRYDRERMEDLLEDLGRAAALNKCYDRYLDLIEEFLAFLRGMKLIGSLDDIFDGLDLDLSEADVVRLVDPFPQTWDICTSLDESQKIGKGLTRLELDDAASLNVKALLNGDGSTLNTTERICARRYAAELPLPEEDWPQWLRGGE
ncbi:hypothetical protein JW848_11085 [Candidatus Bipolaricaulota bacterium]|nr:hypothetical protein [Candidatus Bipolaricaulota bacterium]